MIGFSMRWWALLLFAAGCSLDTSPSGLLGAPRGVVDSEGAAGAGAVVSPIRFPLPKRVAPHDAEAPAPGDQPARDPVEDPIPDAMNEASPAMDDPPPPPQVHLPLPPVSPPPEPVPVQPPPLPPEPPRQPELGECPAGSVCTPWAGVSDLCMRDYEPITTGGCASPEPLPGGVCDGSMLTSCADMVEGGVRWKTLCTRFSSGDPICAKDCLVLCYQ